MSTYLIDRSPKAYGNQQADYEKKTEQVIASSTASLRSAVEAKKNLQEFFHKKLAHLAEERHRIAINHGTENANDFGIFQASPGSAPTGLFTSLVGRYKEYGQRLLGTLQKYVKRMREQRTRELIINNKPCLGRTSSLKISILDITNIKKWFFLPTPDECTRVFNLCKFYPSPNPETAIDSFMEFVVHQDAMRTLRQQSIEDYKTIRIAQALSSVAGQMDRRAFEYVWVLATVQLEINGEMHELSQYVSAMDPKTGRLEQAGKNHTIQVVTIIHVDQFIIKSILEENAKIFEKIVQWKGSNLSSLTNQVALFQFLFAHAMPFKRGSAAIGEWEEKSVYRYHDFNLTYNPAKLVNLEALTLSLNQFVQDYDSMITLVPINSIPISPNNSEIKRRQSSNSSQSNPADTAQQIVKFSVVTKAQEKFLEKERRTRDASKGFDAKEQKLKTEVNRPFLFLCMIVSLAAVFFFYQQAQKRETL
jgi:hypothetical protein